MWLMRRLAHVAGLGIALVALLVFADGIWLAIGLSILAFGAGMLPELFTDLNYSNYCREWELANTESITPND